VNSPAVWQPREIVGSGGKSLDARKDTHGIQAGGRRRAVSERGGQRRASYCSSRRHSRSGRCCLRTGRRGCLPSYTAAIEWERSVPPRSYRGIPGSGGSNARTFRPPYAWEPGGITRQEPGGYLLGLSCRGLTRSRCRPQRKVRGAFSRHAGKAHPATPSPQLKECAAPTWRPRRQPVRTTSLR
jgi:hypothetical protein